MPCEMWDEITHQFPNFNGFTVEVWEWISNFIPHFVMGVIMQSMLGLKLISVCKRAPGLQEKGQSVGGDPKMIWKKWKTNF